MVEVVAAAQASDRERGEREERPLNSAVAGRLLLIYTTTLYHETKKWPRPEAPYCASFLRGDKRLPLGSATQHRPLLFHFRLIFFFVVCDLVPGRVISPLRERERERSPVPSPPPQPPSTLRLGLLGRSGPSHGPLLPRRLLRNGDVMCPQCLVSTTSQSCT